MSSGRFLGKYRGVVRDNRDPERLGRIKAQVPDVLGEYDSGWATPCAPFGGDNLGFFALPAIGAGVWIEFEHGDPEYPVWVGCYWTTVDRRPAALRSASSPLTLLRTEAGHEIAVDDTPGSGGIVLATANGQRIKLDANGIELDNGHGAVITLNGATVSVNRGALEVA